MTSNTEGVCRARHPLFSRLAEKARRGQADGLSRSDVPMSVAAGTAARDRPASQEIRASEADLAEFLACGTSIAAMRQRHEVPRPRLVVDLEDHPPHIEAEGDAPWQIPWIQKTRNPAAH